MQLCCILLLAGNHDMTINEALSYINRANNQPDRYAHIVDMDSFDAYSTHETRESSEVHCYLAFSHESNETDKIFMENMRQMFSTGDKFNILGRYRADDTQLNVISVGTRVALMSDKGVKKDYLLLRIIPVESIRNIWIFPVEYKSAEVGIITRSGAYVIQSTSMKSLSFVEFIRSYNFIDDYGKVEALMDQLSNAVKYTPQGGSIRLTVNGSLLPDGKVRLVYRVADTGLGMSEEFQAEMYNMFARETDSRINNTQGTGLALPIVKQLVDLMKGTITCDSALGKGTTFTVTLDLEKSSAEECQHLCPTDCTVHFSPQIVPQGKK